MKRALLALALAVGCRAAPQLDVEPPRPTPLQGMVVCEQRLAARVGVAVLDRGGNAADAAVATAFALAVVYPQAGNLGGGGFALWVPHSGEPRALDFRERAPSDADPKRYFDADGRAHPERLLNGPLSVGVPGSPAGLFELYRSCGSGKLTFAELLAPAIELARKGFEVDATLAADLVAARQQLSRSPGASALFLPNGEPLRAGARLVQPQLAATLKTLAHSGPDAFYRGEIGKALVRELELSAAPDVARGGVIRFEDLVEYEPKWRTPLRGWFRGREVITMPPPSSGGVILLQVLGVLDGFPLDSQRRAALASASTAANGEPVDAEPSGLDGRAVHWWIEALRLAFASRASVMGDPDFVDVPVAQLLSSSEIASRRVSIGETYAPPTTTDAAVHEGEQTTHLSVIDLEGNAVSLTTTLNSEFGSGMLVRGAGFFLNNELDDFALGGSAANQFGLVGGSANAIEPRKRPLSSMTPTIVRSGGHTVSMVLGSPGGPRITTAVIAVFLRTLVYGESLASAVAAPRFHQQWSPLVTEFERGWPDGVLDELRRRGQPIEVVDRRWASVQAIRVRDDRSVEGVSDPRRGGVALATRKKSK